MKHVKHLILILALSLSLAGLALANDTKPVTDYITISSTMVGPVQANGEREVVELISEGGDNFAASMMATYLAYSFGYEVDNTARPNSHRYGRLVFNPDRAAHTTWADGKPQPLDRNILEVQVPGAKAVTQELSLCRPDVYAEAYRIMTKKWADPYAI